MLSFMFIFVCLFVFFFFKFVTDLKCCAIFLKQCLIEAGSGETFQGWLVILVILRIGVYIYIKPYRLFYSAGLVIESSLLAQFVQSPPAGTATSNVKGNSKVNSAAINSLVERKRIFLIYCLGVAALCCLLLSLWEAHSPWM